MLTIDNYQILLTKTAKILDGIVQLISSKNYYIFNFNFA